MWQKTPMAPIRQDCRKIQPSPFTMKSWDFDGAVELKRKPKFIMRTVLKADRKTIITLMQKPGIAYDIFIRIPPRTHQQAYDTGKERVGYDDNSGLNRNFLFTGTYERKKIIGKSEENWLIISFEKGLPFRSQRETGRLLWNAVNQRILMIVVTGTILRGHNNETAGKILGFTVTARESASLTGETSLHDL